MTATAHYALSDEGTLVYANESGAPPRTLVWVDRQGNEELLGTPVRTYSSPRLSPDATKVALEIRDQKTDIWVLDLMRTTLTRLTFDPGNDRYAVWTPDGLRIAFSSEREGVPNLFWRAADLTGPVERLSTNANRQRPTSFSPQGDQLIVGTYEATAGFDIAVLNLESKRQTSLLQTTAAERNGEIAPDGRWLAYESDESGREEIYVRAFPDVDAGPWQVSTGGGSRPLWARSGLELFYRAPDGALMSVAVEAGTTFTSGTPRQLFQGPYFVGVTGTDYERTYDVSPDGQRFLMIKEGTAGESDTRRRIVVVENWFEELKAKVPTGR